VANKLKNTTQSLREKLDTPIKQAKTKTSSTDTTSKVSRLKAKVTKHHHINPDKADSSSFLHKSRNTAPSYFRNSWAEIKLVDWPSRRETMRLAFAVFIFATIFGLVVTLTDRGLDQLIKKVILK
jgi:preprotein translocase SecE subunit